MRTKGISIKAVEEIESQSYRLSMLQSLPLDVKILWAKQRIQEFLQHTNNKAYISFSGGIDSTVLLDLVRQVDTSIPAVFSNTGLEFPEIVEFVKTFENTIEIKPKMNFKQVIEKWGYPVISKEVSRKVSTLKRGDKDSNVYKYYDTGVKSNGEKSIGKLPNKYRRLIQAPFNCSDYCCNVLKKSPFAIFEKQSRLSPIVGVRAEESRLRTQQYHKTRCNHFTEKKNRSWPLAIWTNQDVLTYLHNNNLPYCSVYGQLKQNINKTYYFTGEQSTGCIFCLFGIHLEKGENRMQRMHRTHPKLHDYCINKLNLKQVLDFIGIKYEQQERGLFE